MMKNKKNSLLRAIHGLKCGVLRSSQLASFWNKETKFPVQKAKAFLNRKFRTEVQGFTPHEISYKKKLVTLAALMIFLLLLVSCGKIVMEEFKPEGLPQERPFQEMPCSAAPGEWRPKQGECPGTTSEMRAKCEEFCAKHKDCCTPGQEGKEYGGRNQFTRPKPEEIAQLTRTYPSVIKAINEGPAIYGQGEYQIISNETLDLMKETGFNTIQLLTINDCAGEKCIMDDISKAVLLNDIVKAKRKGLAVWVAVEFINAPPGSNIKLPAYSEFKPSFIQYCQEIGELMEEYQVEYVTVNNEPDLFLQEQTQWGSKEQIDKYITEIMPLNNLAVKEKFTGKVINKITQPRKRSAEVLAASFKNVDIAGVDVGPPMSAQLSYEDYSKEFDDYQYYASLAERAGLPWMNAEYWQYDFDPVPSQFIKDNQLKYAQVSFEAYLKTNPKGAGYVWNDFGTFSLEPNGEATRQEIKRFFGEIG